MTATRHDAGTGVTTWAMTDAIGRHAEAATAAAITADIAAAIAVHSAPAAALHATRAAINAHYDATHPSHAGDAAIIVIAAYPEPANRHGLRFEIAWAGDIRAYTIRGGHLTQLTTDHTLARTHADAGQPRPPGDLGEDLLTSSVRSGDISLLPVDSGPLLICTSAVYRHIDPVHLGAELASTIDARATVQRLVATTARPDTNAAALLIHARDAPPALVTLTPPALEHRTAPTVTGAPTALARTAFTPAPGAAGSLASRAAEASTPRRAARAKPSLRHAP